MPFYVFDDLIYVDCAKMDIFDGDYRAVGLVSPNISFNLPHRNWSTRVNLIYILPFQFDNAASPICNTTDPQLAGDAKRSGFSSSKIPSTGTALFSINIFTVHDEEILEIVP
jgi:hypothetical protein